MSNEEATKKKPQRMRFNDHEISLIKNTFLDADDLLNALRKHFLQMPLDVLDQGMLDEVRKKKDLLAVIRKTFLPTLDPKAPRHQLVDLWMTVEIKEKSPEESFPLLLARKQLIEYLEQQLTLLEGKKTTSAIDLMSLSDIEGKDAMKMYVDLLARNTMIGHTEQQLAQFSVLAAAKELTPEEIAERKKKNGSQ